MKTIEESLKVENEILEEFFKNRQITEIKESCYSIHPPNQHIYSDSKYKGCILNPQELNVKNTFDLLEYLKPLFIYIASEINEFKEDFLEELISCWPIFQNYYFIFDLVFKYNFGEYAQYFYIGENNHSLKKRFSFNYSLSGDKIKNYFESEIEEKNITYMFNTKPIPFKVVVSILRSDEHMRIMEDERRTGIPLFSVPPGIYHFEFVEPHNLNSKPDKKNN